MTRETSRQAFREATAAGTVSDRQRLALETLAKLGRATGQELDHAAGAAGLWKRLSELKRMGLAVECGVRPCGVTGKASLLWRCRDKSEPPPALPPVRRMRWYAVVDAGGRLVRTFDTAPAAFSFAIGLDNVEVIELRPSRHVFDVTS